MAIKISDDLFKADNYLNTLIEIEAENAKSTVGFDDKTQSFTAWLNREVWDHDDEMIKADGWDLSVHDLNPIMMWVHDYTQKPLGNSLWTRRKLKDDPAGLLWRPSFTTETQEGVDTYKLYKARVLRGFSAGFKPKEIDRKSDKKGRSIFTNVMLLEGSAVPIPANFLSLTLALENDFVKSDMLIKSFDDLLSRTDPWLFHTDMTDGEFEYIEKSFGTVKERRKVIAKLDNTIQAMTKAEIVDFIKLVVKETVEEQRPKDTIYASDYDHGDKIEIELDDQEDIEIELDDQDGEIDVDIEALVEVGES